MRKMIRKALEAKDFKIVAEASNGVDAVFKCENHNPDIVIMDVVMPKMDGLTALQEIMKKTPTRVVVMSSYSPEYANAALSALENGALGFIRKPGDSEITTSSFIREIQEKSLSFMQINMNKIVYKGQNITNKAELLDNTKMKIRRFLTPSNSLVIIGSSTGGPKVVQEIISKIEKPFPPVILIQHLPVGFTKHFAARLDKLTSLNVIEAENGSKLEINTIYVAPAGKHLVLQDDERNNYEIYLYEGDRVNGVIPSIDPTVISASYYYGKNLCLCILTGMGNDGLAGARYCKNNNAIIIAQDEASSMIYGMPKAIVDAELADYIDNPSKIAIILNNQYRK